MLATTTTWSSREWIRRRSSFRATWRLKLRRSRRVHCNRSRAGKMKFKASHQSSWVDRYKKFHQLVGALRSIQHHRMLTSLTGTTLIDSRRSCLSLVVRASRSARANKSPSLVNLKANRHLVSTWTIWRANTTLSRKRMKLWKPKSSRTSNSCPPWHRPEAQARTPQASSTSDRTAVDYHRVTSLLFSTVRVSIRTSLWMTLNWPNPRSKRKWRSSTRSKLRRWSRLCTRKPRRATSREKRPSRRGTNNWKSTRRKRNGWWRSSKRMRAARTHSRMPTLSSKSNTIRQGKRIRMGR